MKPLWGAVFFVVVFSWAGLAQASALHGVFMVVKGEVQILKDGGAPEKARVGSKIHPGQTVATGKDARAKIVMSDRNVINVSPESKLVIEKYENDPKTGTKDVEMRLIEGKVRNNVEQKYDGEKSKFIIKTPTAVAGVRGTQFMTSFSPRTQMTQIVTMKGAVTFASVGANGVPVGPPVVVNRGETASAAAGAPPEPPKALPKEELQKVDAESNASSAPPSDSPAAVTASAPAAESRSGDESSASSGSSSSSGGGGGSGGGSREPAAATAAAPSGPAGASGDRPAPPSSMIDTRDMDVGMAREVTRPPPTAAAAAAPVRPVVAPPPPTANPLPEIIREVIGNTRVIVRPQAQ